MRIHEEIEAAHRAATDNDINCYWMAKVRFLLDENKRLREALSFYADRDNWSAESFASEIKASIYHNDCCTEGDKYMMFSGGKRARAALKESEKV